MQNFIKLSLASLMLFAGFSAQTAFAGAKFNDYAPADCNIVMSHKSSVTIGNVDTNEGIQSPCWTKTSVSVKPGETFNITLYYHNTGDATFTGGTVRLSPNPGTGVISGSQSFKKFVPKACCPFVVI
jgi:cytochrome c oxidase assembly protein Cox11